MRGWKYLAAAICPLAAMSVGAAATAQSESPSASGDVLLEPASPWQLDFADNSCRLSRVFGPRARPSFLSFEQIAPSSTVTMTVAGPNIAGTGDYGTLDIGVRPNEKMVTVYPVRAKLSTYGEGYILTGLSFTPRFFAAKHWGSLIGKSGSTAIDPTDAGAVKGIWWKNSGRTVSFDTGAMSAPLRALNDCAMDLLQHWGLRTDEHAGHSPVELKNEDFALAKLQSTFARGPGRKRHEAILNVRALVEADGSISDCFFEFAAATGEGKFDACAEMRKMQFRPAKTAAGQPMRSFYAASIPLSWVDPLAL
jgi:hypothetical protein